MRNTMTTRSTLALVLVACGCQRAVPAQPTPPPAMDVPRAVDATRATTADAGDLTLPLSRLVAFGSADAVRTWINTYQSAHGGRRRGGMAAESAGDATGLGGGGTGEGSIGMGNLGTMGSGAGTGSGDAMSVAVLSSGGIEQEVARAAVSTGIIILLLGADPSGTLVKLSQYLKTYNKLYFINVNYGKRLDTFLSRIGDMFKTINDKEDLALNSINTRGKLSRAKVTIDFLKGFKDKVIIYIISWILRLFAARLIAYQSCESPKVVTAIYYLQKLSLLAFNLVRADFAFIIPRTILHRREHNALELLIVFIVMVLLFLDCLEWVNMIFDDDLWMRLYRRKKRQIDDLARIANESEERRVDPAAPNNSQSQELNTTDEKSRYSQGMMTQINYKSTYKELAVNQHLLTMMSARLTVDEKVYRSRGCRALFTFGFVRLTIFNLMIACGQYTSGLILSVLLFCELAKLIYLFVLQFKLGMMASKTLYVLEILQCVFLTSFLAMALLIHRMSFNDVIPSVYQTTGIWIVLISCGAEYVFLLVYVGIASVTYYKNRKVRNLFFMRNKEAIDSPFMKRYKNAEESEVPATPAVAAPEGAGDRNEGQPLAQAVSACDVESEIRSSGSRAAGTREWPIAAPGCHSAPTPPACGPGCPWRSLRSAAAGRWRPVR